MLIKPLLRTDRLFYLPLLTLISLLLGCGGGNPNKTQPQPQQSPPAEAVEKPHEKCSVIVSGNNAGISYKLVSESDYKGDLKFNCSYDKENQPTAQQYYLINGVPSLNIVQIIRKTKITSKCSLKNTSFTDTLNVDFNYKKGLVTTNVESTENGYSSCQSNYKPLLETTIASHESIFILLDTWGVDVSKANKAKTGLIKTDCPQTPRSKSTDGETPVCKTTIVNKYTITDDTGKVHTVEKKVSY